MPTVLLASELFDSAAKLTSAEKGRVMEFIKSFQDNPAHPSLKLHQLKKARSKDMWSARISDDLRAILHKDAETWAILACGHHDDAYHWAERRDIGRHPVTGALQIVESVETIREIERVIEVPAVAKAPALFAEHDDAYLLSLGLPESWLPTIRKIRTEDQLLVVCEKLPEELGERLLRLGSGEMVTPPAPISEATPVVDAVDTVRRFYVVSDQEELARALEWPMERWITFLHPSQNDLVARKLSGPAKVSGSAGTGKSVVALHRARWLARQGERVLLTSFVTNLCENLSKQLDKLCTPDERSRITVSTVHKQALDLVRHVAPKASPLTDKQVEALVDEYRALRVPGYDRSFVRGEWESVVRLQGIQTWAEYRSAQRTGRGRGLSVRERKALWEVFGAVITRFEETGSWDFPGICRWAQELIDAGKVARPFTAVVVDEVQDLKPASLRLLAALAAEHPENLLVCGDAGQRIYPGGFSLRALGIDVRGRATILRLNYRTTGQIRRLADRMLGNSTDDMDGGTEARKGAQSLLNGPEPVLEGYVSKEAELAAAVATIQTWLSKGLRPDAVGVFARTSSRVKDLGTQLKAAGVPWCQLSDKAADGSGKVQVGTMHRAKGLEFKCVLVIDCAEGSIPSRPAIDAFDDPADRAAAEQRERQLLYVAMTRARDELHVTWAGRPSPFVKDVLSS